MEYNYKKMTETVIPSWQSPNISSIASLVLGIVSILMSMMPLFNIGGIICGALANSKANKYNQEFLDNDYNPVFKDKKIKASKILGLIGLSASIFSICLYVLYIVLASISYSILYGGVQ